MSEREKLIEKLSDYGYIKSEKVRKAMLRVPREEFVQPDKKNYAYLDQPLSIGHGQTISAPHMVAIICEELYLEEGMKVLEIGTGLGYNAAVVAEIIGEKGHLYSVERIESLAMASEENLNRTNHSKNVTVVVGDGTLGYEKEAPYDRIYVTAGAPDMPEPLKKQLKIGGKLLAPVGPSSYTQELILVSRTSKDEFTEKSLCGVAFVPLIGKHGWRR